MWVQTGTKVNAIIGGSGLLQRPCRGDVPIAAMDAAGRALVPAFAPFAHAADDEIAARKAVLLVNRGDRGYRAARARRRIFPRLARSRFAAAEHVAERGFRDRPVDRRQSA